MKYRAPYCFNSEEAASVLEILPVGKVVGPEGISNRLLRELSRETSPGPCCFYSHSLCTGVVPDSFKKAYISPVRA